MMPRIYPVTSHTDFVGPGTIFVVIRGFHHNGTEHIQLALQKGARSIVVDQSLSAEVQALIVQFGAYTMRVPDCRRALAQMSAHATVHAHKKLKLIGITGTKGKTTTAKLLFHILKESGMKAALLSSVSNQIDQTVLASNLTTPQPDYLHQFFNQCVAQSIEWVVMEVAAQAISVHRIEGLQFDTVIMTNFDREHLEFYDSMDDYFDAKKKLLDFRRPNGATWINADDHWLSKIDSDAMNRFSCRGQADLRGQLKSSSDFSLSAQVAYRGEQIDVECPALSGEYNLYNLLSAMGGALSAGVSLQNCKAHVATFSAIAGRLERYHLENGATALIDYAHNPLSYRELLRTLRAQTNHLIVVFGAGGERDPGRRPLMGKIASDYADLIIITDDNPRHEDPHQIAQAILDGIPKVFGNRVQYESDRATAIQKAKAASHAESIVAVLGKGAEEYQIRGNEKMYFSDRDTVLRNDV